MPLFGDLIAKVEMARLARTLGTLLRNGVPLLTALSIVKETLTNLTRFPIVRLDLPVGVAYREELPRVRQLLLEIVREYSRLHGLPLLFPLLDLEDRRQLPIDVAWSLDDEAIRAASERYGADAILSGRVLESTGGDLVGLWQFLFREQVETFDSFEQNFKPYADAALERITARLSSHYGLIRLSAPLPVRLRVENVDSARDYVDVLQYIQSLAVVDNASTALLNGASLELDVTLIGNPFLFTEFIALGRDMQPVQPFDPGQEQTPALHYRWVR